MNKCENCKFWKRESIGEQIAKGQAPRPQGVCRVSPPRVFAIPFRDTVVMQTVFPLTEAVEWCGAHSPLVSAVHQD